MESFEECWQNLSELRANGNEWATRTMATLEKVSAISVRVAFEQLKRGATLSLADCLEMEFVIVQVRVCICGGFSIYVFKNKFFLNIYLFFGCVIYVVIRTCTTHLPHMYTQRFLREHDFYEGVRAQLVDKDRKPVWSKSLSEITDADVDRYFRRMFCFICC